ncbi:MAG: glucose 1-dehydrogenase [Chloroflexi bacterium]|nr:glucose 1-dehydrogenase [Chloroflexota bacterium]
MRLAKKVALVTGGGSGIGRATAVLFAREGAQVVVADKSEDSARRTADQINSAGGQAVCAAGDVTRSEDSQAKVAAAGDSVRGVDVLGNSAGVSPRNATGPEADEDEVWDAVLDVNLTGTYRVSKFAVPQLLRRGGGSIVNLASIIGVVGYPREIPSILGAFNPYPPSKGGVVQLTRNMATQLAADGIRVNCICPGYVESNLIATLIADPAMHQKLIDRHPIGRLGKPEEIAQAALFLASDESSFVTGAPLMVDGGYTAL